MHRFLGINPALYPVETGTWLQKTVPALPAQDRQPWGGKLDGLIRWEEIYISEEDAVNLIVNGFCKEVLRELPMEFAVEAQNLLGVSLEGAVG